MNRYNLFRIVSDAVNNDESNGIVEFDGNGRVRLYGGVVYGLMAVLNKLYDNHHILSYFNGNKVVFH